MVGHWLRMRWKFFAIKWVVVWFGFVSSLVGIGLGMVDIGGGGHIVLGRELRDSCRWLLQLSGDLVWSLGFIYHFHLTVSSTSLMPSSILIYLSHSGKRNLRTRIQRPTRLCPGHRLRWHPWSILRFGRVIPYWWILSRVQLSIYGGLCRSGILLVGDGNTLDGIEGSIS